MYVIAQAGAQRERKHEREGEWVKENTKREGAQGESRQERSPRSEEEWMPKVVK
jgi:hypothetical protein